MSIYKTNIWCHIIKIFTTNGIKVFPITFDVYISPLNTKHLCRTVSDFLEQHQHLSAWPQKLTQGGTRNYEIVSFLKVSSTFI